MLYVGIVIYMIVCVYAYFMETTLDFWILAMLVATSQGGIQALSRSYFAKLVPKRHANEFFGFTTFSENSPQLWGLCSLPLPPS